jgi:PKD repeat protein
MKSKVIFFLVFLIMILTFFGCQKEPVAGFTASKLNAPPNEAIGFMNNSKDGDHYSWNFGDGTTSEETSTSHAYTNNGTYIVTLTAYSKKDKKSDAVSQTILIGSAPVCSFAFLPKFPKPNETVQFTDNSTNNPISWSWNFGDGGTSNERNPVHAFSSENNYTVSLTVSSNFGSSNQSVIVNVLNQTPLPPVADYSYTVNGTSVGFTDLSTGNPISWLWTFGDGATSTQRNPTHQYAQGGTYTVTLKATNMAGSNQISKSITLLPPVANFSYSVNGTSVSFTDLSTGNPISWLWTFGDGSTSTQQNPTHQYAQTGTYTVTLKATNMAGSNQVSKSITLSNYSFLVGSYSVVDVAGGYTTNYTDNITAGSTSDKFWTAKFGNYSGAIVYFLVNGTSIDIPQQTVTCGLPPNPHTFNGTGYYTTSPLKIYITYDDRSTLGNWLGCTGTYTKLKGKIKQLDTKDKSWYLLQQQKK